VSRFLADLRARAAVAGRRIAFPEAADQRVLDAAVRIASEGLGTPLLVGPPDAIGRALVGRRDSAGVEVVPGPGGEDAVAFAAELVRAGGADGCVAGAVVSTPTVLRAYLKAFGPAAGVRTVSSAFYVALEDRTAGDRVLTFTDAGVVPEPDEAQLVEIARAAAHARRAIVGDEPRVAFLSYSTHGSAGGDSVQRVRAAAARFAELEPDIMSDGELQADAALVPDVARRKAPGSALEGDANVLVFPDLDAANIGYKLVQRLAGATALGPILQGLARPANDLSRGASVSDIVHVACITSLLG
jgi:phosphate acetyltransferase